MSLAAEAKAFLRGAHQGVLSTFSARHPGYPFGSVTPFILDQQAQPIVLISTLAEHTKNIVANAHISLLVLAGLDDLQASGRLTLLGDAVAVDKDDALLRARYLRYFPEAASYFAMHDFVCYRLHITQLRYVAGFGKMSWIAPDVITNTTPNNTLAAQEAAIIDHMNADHAESLIAYCKQFHAVNATKVILLGIDADGFDVCAFTSDNQSQRLRFQFATAICDAATARAAFIALSQACRAT